MTQLELLYILPEVCLLTQCLLVRHMGHFFHLLVLRHHLVLEMYQCEHRQIFYMIYVLMHFIVDEQFSEIKFS